MSSLKRSAVEAALSRPPGRAAWFGGQEEGGTCKATEPPLQHSRSLVRGITVVVAFAFAALPLGAQEPAAAPDYTEVAALFEEHCLDCHAETETEGGLVMETFTELMRGGESGPAIVPGNSGASLLVQFIEGKIEKDGKKKIMPPGKRKKLTPDEIKIVASWVDAGAAAPLEGRAARALNVPTIKPRVPPRKSVNALAYAAGPKLIAAGRYGEVELIVPDTRAVVRRLEGHRGNVNSLVFSADGSELFAAAGEHAVAGEVKQWKVADGTLVRTFSGHKDALFSLALSPDGKILATGSYDQKIKLWDVATGAEIGTLSGHNGAVYALAFRPDGKVLASASGDRTVKLWDVATRERLDTLAQSLKELYTVAWRPDGKRLVAGGVDNRIRVWEISDNATETTNPILFARFAHEGPVLRLLYSPDGKTLLSSAQDLTVKLWDADEVKERLLFEKQPDWPSAVAFNPDATSVVAGRMDGTIAFYDAKTGKVLPPPKPVLAAVHPSGMQRGVETRVRLLGTGLDSVTTATFSDKAIKGELLDSSKTGEKWMKVTAPANLLRGVFDLSVSSAGGESAKVKFEVDDLPQIVSEESTKTVTAAELPATFRGVIDHSGDVDEVEFAAKAGTTVVFDIVSKTLGSKAAPLLTLLDVSGNVVPTKAALRESGDTPPTHTFASDGTYRLRVGDGLLTGSVEHHYGVSMGVFPFVTGCFPLSAPANKEIELELVGFNLGANDRIKVTTATAGEMEVPLDPARYRKGRALKLLVSDLPEFAETEPNDLPDHATFVQVPCAVAGRISSARPTPLGGPAAPAVNAPIPAAPVPEPAANAPVTREEQRRVPQAPVVSPAAPILPAADHAFAKTDGADADLFRFEATAGSKWTIETAAAQRGSPADTKIDVLHADGRAVERLLLQAVRNSAITFRGIDSNTPDVRVENWEEMELNQYLYMQGEVARIFRMPQGPDSGFQFYKSGKGRLTYFDTSSTAHANDEPCYIIEPHLPGSKVVANGLPVFPLFYSNDDDAERQLGTDSRLLFTAPADGAYLVRVRDTRSAEGEQFAYRLVIREARPDFKVTVSPNNPTVNVGSGRSFSVVADRIDGFDGEIIVEADGVPPGFKVTSPIIIQAGHLEANGVITAAPDAPAPADPDQGKSKITATAMINGEKVVKTVSNFGKIKLGGAPKLYISVHPVGANAQPVGLAPGELPEVTIAPGHTVPALLKIKRNGQDEIVKFDVENLPHGVIVDNIGLSGVMIPKGENERTIIFKADAWVPETVHLCSAVENAGAKEASFPFRLRVAKKVVGLQAAK